MLSLMRLRDPRQLRRPQAPHGDPVVDPARAVRLPLPADLVFLAQRRRGVLRNSDEAEVETRGLQIGRHGRPDCWRSKLSQSLITLECLGCWVQGLAGEYLIYDTQFYLVNVDL
jgi:hypothetical protein